MPSKSSEAGIKKSVTKPPKSKKDTITSPAIGTENRHDRHEMIATAAYYRAAKRGFKGNGADAVQDWLEAEAEINNESIR